MHEDPAGALSALASLDPSRVEMGGCVRDLVALAALPSLWAGGTPADVVRVFLDVLVELLHADLAYVACEDGEHSRAPIAADDPLEVGRSLRAALSKAPFATPLLAQSSPAAVPLRAVRLPLGATGQTGEVIVACTRVEFPTETERLLARVAVNHLHVGLTQARLSAARKRDSERLTLLSRASELLSSTLDYETTLSNVVSIALPDLGDFAFFDIVEGDDAVRRIARAHANPPKHELLQATRWVRSERTDLNLCALSTGRSAIHPRIDDEWMKDVAVAPEHLALMRQLAFLSMVTVPLAYQGRLLGALTLFFAESGRSHTADDLALAEELSRRAAAAVENARLCRALEDAVRRKEDADRRKDEFLAMLGHELRNPLSPILTALHLMKEKEDAKFARERLIIHRQVRHLERLVDDLLDLSRVTSGNLELRREPTEMHELVTRAVELVGPLVEQKRHRLEVAIPTEGLRVNVDRVRMSQVITNLLMNASKYTPDQGQISVTVQQDAAAVTLTVRDNGNGIAAELLPHLFEMFVQAPQTLARSRGGLGLGLTIAKRLVEAHGGEIRAHSDGLRRGSRFDVRVPLAHATPGRQTALDEGPQAAHRGGAERRVLVVDDNRDAAELLGDAMAAEGHDVRIAFDGTEALTQAETFRPNVIVLDIGLPALDGYEVARRLRAQPWAKATKLVALTGYGQEGDKARAVASGFDCHLVKPVTLDVLLDIVGSR